MTFTIEACVALDDFGTGYSSLSYLTSINVDKIKADRSFISCINDNARNNVLASTIVKLGHQLNLEGFKKVSKRKNNSMPFAKWNDVVQGYFYSKPMPMDQVIPWLQTATFE